MWKVFDWLMWDGVWWLIFGGYLFMLIWIIAKMVREDSEED